jgi:hypothetical protein
VKIRSWQSLFRHEIRKIVQARDLLLFGSLKKLQTSDTREFDDRSMNNQVTKLLQVDEQAASFMTIHGSFQKAGLIPDTRSRPFRLQFDEGRFRENAGSREIWEGNVTIVELSRRRRVWRFGITNSEFLIADSFIIDE